MLFNARFLFLEGDLLLINISSISYIIYRKRRRDDGSKGKGRAICPAVPWPRWLTTLEQRAPTKLFIFLKMKKKKTASSFPGLDFSLLLVNVTFVQPPTNFLKRSRGSNPFFISFNWKSARGPFWLFSPSNWIFYPEYSNDLIYASIQRKKKEIVTCIVVVLLRHQ